MSFMMSMGAKLPLTVAPPSDSWIHNSWELFKAEDRN